MSIAWWIGVVRAVIELAMFCLLGQGILALLAGRSRHDNPVYRLLCLLTIPPRQLCALVFPQLRSAWGQGIFCLTVLFGFWIGLAFFRKMLDH